MMAAMRYLTRAETAAMIEPDTLRRAVGQAMVELSAGRVSMPPRVAATREDPIGLMAVMPAYVPALDAMATKVVNVFPGNAARDLPTHLALVLLVEPETGEPIALLDGDEITAARTAAGSALSAEHLAVPDAATLTIVGTGVQARSHAHAVSRVRSFTEVRVAGRDPAKAATLAAALDDELDASVIGATSIEAACVGADVVCATTDASTPVLRREWLGPGTHVTSVGFAAGGPEIDGATVADAFLVVESRASAFSGYPVGTHDLREPFEAGLIDETHVRAELGELVDGTVAGPDDSTQLTLYKSAGVAVQDAAAAKLVHDAALAAGVGVDLER